MSASVGSTRQRQKKRGVLVAGLLCASVIVFAFWALTLGDLPLTIRQVFSSFSLDSISAALSGEADFRTKVVLTWRLPRVVAAVFFGAALGISGALFQSLTRNPLGSPDIIGFSSGAYTGVILTQLFIAGSTIAVGAGAMAGGLAVAVLIYLLSYRNGIANFRLIIVGIGITAMLSALNTWLLLRSSNEVALSLATWGAGSLSNIKWAEVLPALAFFCLAIPLVAACSRPLRQLELGDDAAASHGLSVEPTRLAIMILGIALTCAVTAAAGPIGFVALASPQIAKLLTRGASIPLLNSALVGSLTLVVADLIAQYGFGQPVPAGAVTTVLGGAYLIVLLMRGRTVG